MLWRDPHCLNIAVVVAVVHSLLGLSRLECMVEPLTLSPLFPLSLSLISHLAVCLLTYPSMWYIFVQFITMKTFWKFS